VRDGLSLLDQAIAHGAGAPTVEQVRDMLGLADRARLQPRARADLLLLDRSFRLKAVFLNGHDLN
jgi:N-acetylglucosamine-6-phosphate deacetylase